jgi:2-desacetyl-2-hydroxyethyl bacteriochlorophyllide A dehydrogenase
MKAAQFLAPHKLRVIEADVPEAGAHDVIIQVQNAGICGTDIHILHGEYFSPFPLTPGHEFSGKVAAVGAGVKNFEVGDRVTADPNIPCNRCFYCQRNQPNQCEDISVVGVTRAGAFAEYVVVPEGVVFHIGDIPFDEAALIEPLACVVWGLQRVQPQPGDNALVLGAGPMGYLVAQALRQAGTSQTIITDVVPQRLELAESLGLSRAVVADENQPKKLEALAPRGFDIVVDATGIAKVLEQAFHYTRPRGKVWVFGVVPIGEPATFIPYDVFRKDLTIIGSFAVNRTFHESIVLIESGAVQVKPLISHTFPLEDFARGMDVAQNAPDRIKVQYAVAT